MNIIPVGGKTPSSTAAALSVDANGMLETKKTWVNDFTALQLNGSAWITPSTTAKYTDALDVSDAAMVILMVTNSAKDSSSNAVPVTFSFLRTDVDNSTELLRNLSGDVIQFNTSTAYVLVTPDDIPELKYLKYIRFKIQSASAVSTGQVNIKVFKKR